MKLKQLTNPKFKLAVSKLSGQNLPLRTAFRLKSITKLLNEKISDFESVRIAALNKYGEKNESGEMRLDAAGNAVITAENMNIFIAELQELYNTDIDIGTISQNELGNDISMTADELMALDDFLI